MADMLKPSPALLAKIGSIVVHADELLSSDGHAFDRVAMDQLLSDPEVKEWLEQMSGAAMVPRKRLPSQDKSERAK